MNNFDLKKFLTENKLTQTSKAIVEVSDPGFDQFMDAVDDLYMDHPRYEELQNAVEDALNSGQIDSRPYEPGSYTKQVVQIAKEMGIKDSDQYDSPTDMPGFEGTRDALNNLGLKEYQHLEDLNQPNPAKGMEGRHSMEEEVMDDTGHNNEGVSRYLSLESAEEVIKELEKDVNKATMEAKLSKMKEVIEAIEAKADSLEEDAGLKGFISPKKLSEMRKMTKKLRVMQERYVKEYDKKFKSTKTKMNEGTSLIETSIRKLVREALGRK